MANLCGPVPLPRPQSNVNRMEYHERINGYGITYTLYLDMPWLVPAIPLVSCAIVGLLLRPLARRAAADPPLTGCHLFAAPCLAGMIACGNILSCRAGQEHTAIVCPGHC